MITTKFIEKFKKNGHVFETEITVERTPATVSDLRMTRGRYWDAMGDSITEAFSVKVSFRSIHGGVVDADERFNDRYIEVVTPAGRGVVVRFSTGDELMAFIPNTGKALIHGCWKKYGSYRGHAVSYLRGYGKNPNSKAKVYHTCAAHLYDAAIGGSTFKAAWWFHQQDNPRNLAQAEESEGLVKYRVPGFPYVAGIIPRSLFHRIFERYTYSVGFQAEDWFDCTFWFKGRVFLIYYMPSRGEFKLCLSGTVLLQSTEVITIPDAVEFLERDDRKKSYVEG